MMKITSFVSFAVLGLSLALTSFTPANAETGVTPNEIRIGQSAVFSGPNAKIGEEYKKGALAYFNEVNRNGGIFGRQIVLTSLDDGYEDKRAKENTRILIEDDKVFALFGYVGTPTSNAAIPAFTEAGVPFFAPMTGADSMRRPFNPNIFNVRASYADEVKAIFKQLGNGRAKRVAVLYQDDAYGQSVLASIVDTMGKMNATPLETASFKRNSLEVDDAVKKLAAKHPETILMVGAYGSCAAFINKIRPIEPVAQFWNISFVGSTALATELTKKNPDGGRNVMLSEVVPFPFGGTSLASMESAKVLRSDMGFTSFEGYLAARVFVEGLRRAGPNLTRKRFTDALEHGEIDIIDYRVNFSPASHEGSHFVDVTTITHNGVFIE